MWKNKLDSDSLPVQSSTCPFKEKYRSDSTLHIPEGHNQAITTESSNLSNAFSQ